MGVRYQRRQIDGGIDLEQELSFHTLVRMEEKW
jgi:hypothetical protein